MTPEIEMEAVEKLGLVAESHVVFQAPLLRYWVPEAR